MDDESKIGSITWEVAQWAVNVKYEDVPKEVIDFAKLSILDGIGCTVLGSTMQAGGVIFKYVDELDGGKPEATIWGRGRKTSVRLTGLVNGTSAHTTNMGDDHHPSGIHTNYLMPQAAIAVAEKEGIGGRGMLTAFVVGNEICTRAAMATHVLVEGGYYTPEARGWHPTGAIGAIGTSVAAAKLLGLSAEQMVQAIVLGGTQPTGIYRPSGSYMGKHLYAGKAVANGIESGYIARKGFIAGYRLFEDGLCYGTGIISPVHELEAAAKGLGEIWETLNNDFSIYPSKKTFNSNLDALLYLIRTEDINFRDIEKIKVLSAYTRAHAHATFVKPTNSTEALSNLHYAIAVAAHDGDYWFEQLEKTKFEDPEILAFAKDRVEVVRDPELEKLTPKTFPGAVEILTKDGGRLYKRFDAHKGEASNPLTREELHDKFRRMGRMLDKRNIDAIIGIVNEMETLDDLQKLTGLLSP